MASISMTFVSLKEGMQAVSFNMKDEDLNRVYEAYKSIYMSNDYNRLNDDIPDDDMHDRKELDDSQYSITRIFERLSDEILYSIVLKVKQIETDKIVENADVQLIEIKV